MTRSIRKWFGILLCALLLAALGASALAEGSLTVELASFKGVQFAIYQIGVPDDASPSGWSVAPAFKGLFKDGHFPKPNEGSGQWTADEAKTFAKNAQVLIDKNQIEPVAPLTIGPDGAATVGGLADGIYCGVMTQGPSGLVDPFVVAIPMTNSDDPYHVTAALSGKVHLPAPVSVDVTKEWVDADNRDGIQPKAVKVYLKCNDILVPDGTTTHYGTTITSPVSLTQENNLYYKWDRLDPVDSSGNPCVYTVEEEPVKDYTASIVEKTPGSFVITNSHKPLKGSLTIEKRMQLNGEDTTDSLLDGKEFTFTLTGPTRAEDFAALGIQKTKDNYVEDKVYKLPILKGKASTTIHSLTPGHYIVREIELPEGVTLVEELSDQGKEILVEADNTASIPVATFVNDVSTGSLRIEKSVTVNGEPTQTSLADGTYSFTVTGPHTNKTLSLTIENGVTAESEPITGLLPGTYKVAENTSDMPSGVRLVAIDGKPASGNIATVEVKAGDETALSVASFTNDRQVGTLMIRKVFAVTGTGTYTQPQTFSFEVTGPYDYRRTVSITVDAGSSNTEVLSGLPVGEYTVREITSSLPAAIKLVSGSGEKKELLTIHTDEEPLEFVIKNEISTTTTNPPPSTVTTTPPSTVTTAPPRTRTTTPPVTTTASPSLTPSGSVTPSITPSGSPSQTPPVTPSQTPPSNTPEPTPTPPPTTRVDVRKIWNDQNNIHNTRPASITVLLLRNGVRYDEATFSGNANGWFHRFSNLPAVDENGAPIDWSISEVSVDGYTTTVNGTTIVNDMIVPKTEYNNLYGKKLWEDGSDAAGRPNSIVVVLYQDGQRYETRTVTSENNWQFAFQDLPLTDGFDHTYTYEVREEGVAGYFSRVNDLTITNYRLPADEEYEFFDDMGTPLAGFREEPEEKLEELVELFDYKSPLWGERLLPTGDDMPIYPFIFGGIGLTALGALVMILVIGRKKEQGA